MIDTGITAPELAVSPDVLESLAAELTRLRERLLEAESRLGRALSLVHTDNQASARNLVHYLALRRQDVRELQLRLARVGLSSLGRCEPHVQVTLDRMLAMLSMAGHATMPSTPTPPVGFRHGEEILSRNAAALLGPARSHRPVRIVVTLPSDAATDAVLVRELVRAGMDCARINCAHDDAAAWGAMADNLRAAFVDARTEGRILVDLGGPKLRLGEFEDGDEFVRLSTGDRLEIVPAHVRGDKSSAASHRVTCALPEIFRDTQPGQSIWFDDGKLGGVIERSTASGLLVRIVQAKPKGVKLRPGRGINLPDTRLTLPALTAKDIADLGDVAHYADAVELSFVQHEDDVLALQQALREHDAADAGIVLKIETRAAFANLPRLLLTAMRSCRCGVMIARGDLAVECGFERLAEVQEEILWIAEAAHVPTIWATQVLESLAKKGLASRAEVTDAAMSSRAEAVMLNKGPCIADAIRTLDGILGRMQEHQSKKRSLYRALNVTASLWSEPGGEPGI